MLEITPISEEHVEEIARLAGECFLDDPFYSSLSSDIAVRQQNIEEIFKKSTAICIRYGYAFGIRKEESFVAFSLWFNYEYLKNYCPEEFRHIFYENKGTLTFNDSLNQESQKIDEAIKGNREILFLLAIAVKKTFRKKGYASGMIEVVQQAFPHLGIFADISNRESVVLYEHLGFLVQQDVCGCKFVRYFSPQEKEPVTSGEGTNQIWLAVPENFNARKINIPVFREEKGYIPYLETIEGENPYFKYSLYHRSKVRLLAVSFAGLIKYQQYINVTFFDEIKYEVNHKSVVAYVTDKSEFPGLHQYDEYAELCCNKKEAEIIPDVYVSIPVEYSPRSLKVVLKKRKNESFLVNRVLKALEFRTTYEAGIPTEKPLIKNAKPDERSNQGENKFIQWAELEDERFKYRIKRYYLGSVKIQILQEKVLQYNGTEEVDIPCGNPLQVELILSVDQKTKCGVLHLIVLSCGTLITQFLDSVSRNQLYVKVGQEYRNLYSYLYDQFKIRKKGSARNFLTIMDKRDHIPDDLLASMLFCETLYEDGECLGRVIDEEVLSLLSSPNGSAQYNYATVYAYRNILLQMSDSFQGRLYNRIYMESVTLLYIELILFEEAAIEIANDEIIRFLGTIDEYSPRAALKKINTVLSEHLKSIEFWNIQVNYPSSQKSIDDIRKAFHMNDTRKMIERNQKELQMIHEMRSDIVDKAEATFFSALGAIFTIISVMNFITDSGNHSKLLITFSIIFLTIGLYRYYLKTHIFYKENVIKKYKQKWKKK